MLSLEWFCQDARQRLHRLSQWSDCLSTRFHSVYALHLILHSIHGYSNCRIYKQLYANMSIVHWEMYKDGVMYNKEKRYLKACWPLKTILLVAQQLQRQKIRIYVSRRSNR